MLRRLSTALSIALALSLAAVPQSVLADAAGQPRMSCSPDGPPPVTAKKPHWQLRQQLAAMFAEAGTPGAAVIALRNDHQKPVPLFEMYYGCQSLLPDESWPVTQDTSFLLASLSKTLTATTVLHLADRTSHLNTDHLKGLPEKAKECLGPSDKAGHPRIAKLMDCPIENFFPPDFQIDFPCPNDPLKSCSRDEKIRFVNLLEHTSGIIDDFDGPLNCVYNLDANSPMTLKQIVERYLDRDKSKGNLNELVCVNVSDIGWETANYKEELYSPNNFGPFGVFKYSNSGYSLLGYMVERVLEEVCPRLPPVGEMDDEYAAWRDDCQGAHQPTPGGSPYPMWKYSHHTVFDRLGLSGEGELAGRWRWSDMKGHQVCADLDEGKGKHSDRCPIARPAGDLPYYNFPGYPNGGFRATARALSHFLSMLMHDGTFTAESGKKQEILSPETAQGIWNFTTRPWPWQALTSRGFTFTPIGFALQAAEIPEDYNAFLVGHTGGEMGVATSMFWQPAPVMDDDGKLHNGDKSLGVLVITSGNGLDPEIMVSVFKYFQEASIP